MLQASNIRNVLITGTSTGIGRACAIRLAREGFGVFAGVLGEKDSLSIEQAGAGTAGGIRAVPLDVTDAASVAAAAEHVGALAGEDGLYGLVNNAGICIVGPVECLTLAEWRRQFEVNVFGAISVTQAMLPLLRVHNAARRGAAGRWAARIINMGSTSGVIATPLFGAYGASKFALRAMNDALRLELWPEGIHVCLIVPGIIQTEIWRKERQSVETIRTRGLAQKVYGKLIDNVAGYVFKQAERAISPEHVALSVQRCLTSATPRIRSRVGRDAIVASLARKLMPDRVLDFMLRRTLGVVRETSAVK